MRGHTQGGIGYGRVCPIEAGFALSRNEGNTAGGGSEAGNEGAHAIF